MDTGVEELAYIEGRLQAVRLYEATNDSGVKDMLSWLIARDTMHQNQWLAAIKELEAKENIVVPSTFPRNLEKREVSHFYLTILKGMKALGEDGRMVQVWMVKDNSNLLKILLHMEIRLS